MAQSRWTGGLLGTQRPPSRLTGAHTTRTGLVSESAPWVVPVPWFWEGACGPPYTFLGAPVNIYFKIKVNNKQKPIP